MLLRLLRTPGVLKREQLQQMVDVSPAKIREVWGSGVGRGQLCQRHAVLHLKLTLHRLYRHAALQLGARVRQHLGLARAGDLPGRGKVRGS